MKKDQVREIALNALCKIILEGSYSNLTLKRILNDEDIEQIDKNLITEITYGTLKYKYAIDMILNDYIKINKTDKKVLIILEMSIFQLKYLDRVPDYAVINESVELSKKINKSFGGFVNGVLRNYLRRKDEFNIEKLNLLEKMCFIFSYPEGLVKLLRDQYGESTEFILDSLNKIQRTTLRINNLKISPLKLIKMLKDENIEFEPSKFSDKYVIIKSSFNVEKMQIYLEGLVSVQNESSMLAAKFLGAKEKEDILDLCAAPGGKSCYLAESLNDNVNIISCDIHEHRIKLIKNNYKRLGINSIKTRVLDGIVLENSFVNRFHRVLVDVPCSGFGVIRKKPEIKYAKIDFDKLIEVQKKILKSASLYLKPGGTMVYSTCTLNKQENERVIEWFLKDNKDFTLEEVETLKMQNILYNTNNIGVTILPSENLDGFYICKIRKCESKK